MDLLPSTEYTDPNALDATQTYRWAFVTRCHTLLALGYEQLSAKDFARSQETEISGELVRKVAELLESDGAPDWAAQFDIHDDPPQQHPERKGKRRRRADLAFILVQHGARPKLRFEAKRLNGSKSVSSYLGKDGLGLFVSGEYAPEGPDTAMLGYVQSGEIDDWLQKLREGLQKRRKKSALVGNEVLPEVQIVSSLRSFSSRHLRKNESLVEIAHTMLRFH